jgi:hypothetical protein
MEMKFSTVMAPLLFVLIGASIHDPALRLNSEEDRRMAGMTIEEVLKQNTDHLLSIPGVVGTAIGEYQGRPCIMVLVEKRTADVTKRIPSEIGGFVVVVEETGTIRRLERKSGTANPN